MKIINLKLKNFMGIRNLELNFNGKNASIYGTNATGKTTCFSAFTWLLFDKDSQNKKDFEIKTLGPDGEPEHGLEHTVEAELELENGKRLTLKKIYSEKWTKKRGSATAEFTGHTTDHFLNGVPVKKSEYDAKITEIADEQIFRLLTDPRFFNEQLHWQKRRDLLMEICGGVTNAELAELENQRKVIKAQQTKINRELQKIPVRIDEVQIGLPDITASMPEKLSEDIVILRQMLQKKQQELARIESGGEIAEKTKKLRELEAELLEMQNQHRAKYEKEIQEKQKLLNQAKEKVSDLLAALKGIEKSMELQGYEQELLKPKIADLRQKWHEINDQQFEYEQDEICPTCGQPLPAEKLVEAREKALARFNLEKAEKLEKITAEGKQLREHFDRLGDEILGLEKKIAETRSELEAEEKTVEQLEKVIADLRQQMEHATANDREYNKKYLEKLDLEKTISELKKNNAGAVAEIKEEIKAIEQDIATLEQEVAKIRQREQGLKRIEELKAEERKLASEYEELERQLYEAEETIRVKAHTIEKKINSKFKMARFKLFDMQVNGAVIETCETIYDGVPYSNLNNGARLNVGLDIINVLADHFGFAPPVWIDNAESVTNILPTKGQQIQLIVSEKDKKLRIEIAEKKIKRRMHNNG